METVEYIIKDEHGLHARPAGLIAKTAKEFESEIILSVGDKQAKAIKLFEMMALSAKQGQTLIVAISGTDEKDAALALQACFAQAL